MSQSLPTIPIGSDSTTPSVHFSNTDVVIDQFDNISKHISDVLIRNERLTSDQFCCFNILFPGVTSLPVKMS